MAQWLPRSFFARSAAEVGPELIGAVLIVDGGTPTEVRACVVEVEAYLGTDDPASHAHRGPTPRSRIMFGPPGHLYVYFSYGVHHCANVVCSPEGTASAVLLRAAVVEHGEAVVRQRRGVVTGPAARLLSGPGNLCRGLGIGAAENGADVTGGRVHFQARESPPPISVGARLGISRAVELPLRYWASGQPAVSGRRGEDPRAPHAAGAGEPTR